MRAFEDSKECPKCGSTEIDLKFINTYDTGAVRFRDHAEEFLNCRCSKCEFFYKTEIKGE